MSDFFADENSIVHQSPNLDVSIEIGHCKPVVGIVHSPIALFMSPVQVFEPKPLVENDAPLLEEVDNIGTSPSLPSSSSTSDPDSEVRSETDEQRIKRENEESERLCWEMMREESMNAYRVQMEFINASSNEMSAEDLEAIQNAMKEGNNFVPDNEENEVQEDEGEVLEEEKEQEQEESDVDQWDYDRLLALGEVIGDVKTERWRLKSKAVISNLPKMSYTTMKQRQITFASSCSSSSTDQTNEKGSSIAASTTVIDVAVSSPKHKRVRYDPSCAICIEAFIGNDELNVLPCQHYFHESCTQGWLVDHNSCPICKTEVSTTP